MRMRKWWESLRELFVASGELAACPGHGFHRWLIALLVEYDFDHAVEAACVPFYDDRGAANRSRRARTSGCSSLALRGDRLASGDRLAVCG